MDAAASGRRRVAGGGWRAWRRMGGLGGARPDVVESDRRSGARHTPWTSGGRVAEKWRRSRGRGAVRQKS
ncbi:hypothetical protein TPA0910_46940 [Streptomyces hygroscopicus subsp. sporocinereus]|uniref:Uncharacterized protein n=1 Tax=Streptomyces hygroscopicus TaxID=1912 RepID=A0ABQ3U4T1_STRHY|nr:hypothetical protein TPA0910_46940 [Streptomyces hygroscopicus]